MKNALHVPDLSYNLISVSKASKSGNMTKFDESGCQIMNSKNAVIATATRCGSLYFLDCQFNEQANAAENKEGLKECRDVDTLEEISAEETIPDQVVSETRSLVTSELDEPKSYEDVATSFHKTKWERAMEAEMKSLQNNDVWELVELPEHRKTCR